MIGFEYILLMNTGLFAIVLIVLLLISGRKSHKPKAKKKNNLNSDMQKIKEQISLEE